MLRDIDNYYLALDEPVRGCLLAMRTYVLGYHPQMTEAWKYRMPFFCYKGRMFCYLWTRKDTGQPYVGIVEGGRVDHPLLIQEKRSRMKIMLLAPENDLPVEILDRIFRQAMEFYR